MKFLNWFLWLAWSSILAFLNTLFFLPKSGTPSEGSIFLMVSLVSFLILFKNDFKKGD